MWFEEPDIAKVQFNTKIDNLKYQFTQSMQFEELGMTNKPKYGRENFH